VQKIDLDKLIVRLAAIEKLNDQTTGVGLESIAVKTAYERLGQLLDLQKVIKNLPVVARAAAETQARLLKIISELVSDPQMAEIERVVEAHLNDSAIGAKRGSIGALSTVTARVYAVKAETNPLLDVARASYKENVHDIFDLGKTVREKYELPIELVYQQENGGAFVFCLPRAPTEESGWRWPKEWVDRVQKKKKWVFSTLELKKLNGRMREMLDETLTISATIVQEVFSQVVSRISALYKASEAIALLDVLLCFAKRSLSTCPTQLFDDAQMAYGIDGDYGTNIVESMTGIDAFSVRPEFTGTLAIKSGRHPVLETIQEAGRTVANDVYADESSRFQIIRGPHVGVMASCGCFVPAEYASFKLYDSLLTRLSNEDDFERSLSTFSHEMVTSSMILGLSTKDSLVLVDELGRGTSPVEGVGIAHAIAEELIDRRARLELARLADLPSEIINEASRVSGLLLEREQAKKKASAGSQITMRRKTLLNLSTELTQILKVSMLSDDDLSRYLLRLQNKVGAELAKSFDENRQITHNDNEELIVAKELVSGGKELQNGQSAKKGFTARVMMPV
ncbi:MutS protein msh4, partial [Serendipita sp. 399]